MPAIPVSLFEPVWAQFAALLPAPPTSAPTHPLGCHRCRVPGRVVFAHVVAALVHGSGDERVASLGCSDRPPRRRLEAWAAAGVAETPHALALEQYDRVIGLDLADLAVDGCITNTPGGGETGGRSPVDRGQQGLKRSTVTDAAGVPRQLVAAGVNRHDGPLLGPTLPGLAKLGPLPPTGTVHLDHGDDRAATRTLLAEVGLRGEIAREGVPAPIQVGMRWGVERTQAWMNGSGKPRRCPERRAAAVDCSLFLAAAFVVTRRLIDRARTRSRWPTRPTTRRLR